MTVEQESYDDGIDHSSVSINQEELQARNQSIKRRFPRSYFTNSGKGLSALIKAVVRFFPWEVQHSKKAAAWAQVAEDFNSTLPPSHPRLSGARAKEVIESQISIYTSYLEDSEKSSEFISGHSFTDPEVVASMGKLLERKSAFDKKAAQEVAAHGQELLLKSIGAPIQSRNSTPLFPPETASSDITPDYSKKQKMDDAVQSLLDCQQNSFMAENEYRAECMKMKKEALELQKEMHEEEMRIRREELIEKRLEREMYNQARMAELQIFQSILSKLPGDKYSSIGGGSHSKRLEIAFPYKQEWQLVKKTATLVKQRALNLSIVDLPEVKQQVLAGYND